MQPSRDSSVWRSLAVAFGDGLAFGVGMKLTQPGSARSSAPSPETEADPLSDRLEQIEKRLAYVEQKPTTVAGPQAPFDKKVLEAVVQALESRLREQSQQVEQKLAALETKIAADLKALRQQDHAIATAVENHLEELQDHFINQVEALRQRMEEDRAAMRQEVASAVVAASAGAIEERVAPLRAEAAEKDQELAALRQRAEDSDAAMLELLNGIGQLIHQAASRNGAAPALRPAETTTPGEPSVDPAPAAEATPLLAFAQGGKPGRLWRVPLVSSLVIAAGSMVGAIMLHYL